MKNLFQNETEFNNASSLVEVDAINNLSKEDATEVFKTFRLDAIIGNGIIKNDSDKAVCQLIINRFPDMVNLCKYSILNKNTENEKIQWTIK